jgi:hypothetical protein
MTNIDELKQLLRQGALRYIVQTSFAGFKRGQVIAMTEEKAEALVKAGNITELSDCPTCGEYAWWLSVDGKLVCGVCRLPKKPELLRWVGGRLNHIGATERRRSMGG